MSVFSRSINQWCYGKDCSAKLPNAISIAGRKLYYSNNTQVREFKGTSTHVVILGTYVDLLEHREDICDLSFDDFLNAIDGFCGVYVIFLSDCSGVKIFGDASHLLSIYYGVSGKSRAVAASCEALIVDDVTDYSNSSLDVVKGAYSSGLYLADDMTMYDSVKCLLPNYYLDLLQCSPVRCFPRKKLVAAKGDEVSHILETTFNLTIRGIRLLAEKMSFAAPLTPGGDSRVNCVLLKHAVSDKDVQFYVISNVELRREPDNLQFIGDIAKKIGIKDFRVLPEVEVLTDEQLTEMKAECGEIRNWGKTLWCYHPELHGKAIVKGELIDQIGKSPYGRGMPEWMASKFFLKTILSNTSKTADEEFSNWYEKTKTACMGYSMFDLYSWEVRCGRWNPNTQSIQNINGVENINFFNCTYILSEWCRIPRKLRVKKCIHNYFIGKLMPDLLSIPVNPYAFRHSKHLSPMFSKFVPYWCRWIAQYAIQKVKASRNA